MTQHSSTLDSSPTQSGRMDYRTPWGLILLTWIGAGVVGYIALRYIPLGGLALLLPNDTAMAIYFGLVGLGVFWVVVLIALLMVWGVSAVSKSLSGDCSTRLPHPAEEEARNRSPAVRTCPHCGAERYSGYGPICWSCGRYHPEDAE
jgi:hypothetical protein